MGRRAAWLLCSAELLAAVIAGASLAPAFAAPTTVTVDGQQPFTSTGLSVKKGELIKVTATGRINYCGGSAAPDDNVQPQCDATPDGSVSGESHCGGSSRCGSLIGRIGGGATFPVGSNFLMTASASGALDLGIQDFDDDPDGVFDNNEGSFTAEVEIDPPGRIEGRVVDGNGHGIPAAKVKAAGPAKLAATTDFDGYYAIDVPKKKSGRYEVAPNVDDQVFRPKEKRVRVADGETSTAYFQGLCSIKGGSRAARVKHGLYSNGTTSVYYSCVSKTVRTEHHIGELECDGGSGIAYDGALSTSKGTISGGSFRLRKIHQNVRFTFPGLPPSATTAYGVSLVVSGRFVANDTIDAEVSVIAGETDKPTCVDELLTTLPLADPDPSPFD